MNIEITNLEVPAHYVDKIVYIIKSGVLDLKAETGHLHFDSQNRLKIIEYPKKIYDSF